MSIPKSLPTPATAVTTIAAVTLKRVMRGAMLWITVVAAVLPAIYAFAMSKTGVTPEENLAGAIRIEMALLGIVVSLLIAWPVGEEVDDRSATYLWSRPFPRWAILIGKLLALTPVAIVIFEIGWLITVLSIGGTITPAAILGLAAGVVVASLFAAAIALVLPRHSLALSIVVLGLLDQGIGNFPAAIHNLAYSYHTRVLAGYQDDSAVGSAIWLLAFAALWLWLGLRRIHKTQL